MESAKFELRKLNAGDVAPMAAIISKIGLKEFKSVFSSTEMKSLIAKTGKEDAKGDGDESDNAAMKVGMVVVFDLAGIILDNYIKCEKEIFKFLASLSGQKESDIKALPLDVFFEMIITVLQKDEFKDFFKVVSKLLK